jgi:hypothetical protein
MAGPPDLDHFSVGVPAEVDLVGLAFGLRPELTWRPFGAQTATHFRVATGLMAGPELLFVPASLGVRGRWFPRGRVHPVAGFVAELQGFWSSGHPFVVRPSFGIELGVDVTITGTWSVGLIVEPGFAPKPDFGFGMAARLGVTRSL